MYYSEDEARRLVIEAGHRLLSTGLIARTWGNISARISKDEFIITPSGRAYDTLLPEELVKVNANDLSYAGDIKPSSEKGIHAVAYILRPEVGFIIHTHQFYASVVGIEGKNTSYAATADYALPGTDKLKTKLMKAISQNPDKVAFLMQKHGALCLGTSCEDAFDIADKLEKECELIFKNFVGEVENDDYISACAQQRKRLLPYIDDFAQILGASVLLNKPVDEICSGEDREAQKMILVKNCAAALYAKARHADPLGVVDANLQRYIYLNKYSKLKK